MHRIEGENVDTSTGVNLFKETPPYTTQTPAWTNALQEEIMNVLEYYGLPSLTENSDTRDQLLTALRRVSEAYDYVVDTQVAFVNLFTRRAANEYEIYGDYHTVVFKYIAGGYSFANVLSGGDTWGDIYTNNATHIHFQNGAYIDFANAIGNITVETDDCLLENLQQTPLN